MISCICYYNHSWRLHPPNEHIFESSFSIALLALDASAENQIRLSASGELEEVAKDSLVEVSSGELIPNHYLPLALYFRLYLPLQKRQCLLLPHYIFVAQPNDIQYLVPNRVLDIAPIYMNEPLLSFYLFISPRRHHPIFQQSVY